MDNVILWAPEEYWKLTLEEKKSFRCGPSNGLLERLVPDVWWFGWPLVKPIVVTPCCSIHDFQYRFGPPDETYREHADRVFKNNLLRLVDHEGGPWPVLRIRRRKCYLYYRAVRNFGGPYYWEGKNPCAEVRGVDLSAWE